MRMAEAAQETTTATTTPDTPAPAPKTPDAKAAETEARVADVAKTFEEILEEEGMWTDPDAEPEADTPPDAEPDEDESGADEDDAPKPDEVDGDKTDDGDADDDPDGNDKPEDDPDDKTKAKPRKTEYVPPWKREKEERRNRQADKIEREYEQQMRMREQLFEEKLARQAAEFEAKLAALKPSGPPEATVPDKWRDFEKARQEALASGKTPEQFYELWTERNVNGGAPGGLEAIEYAKKLQEKYDSELEQLRKEREAEKEKLAKESQQAQQQAWISDGVLKVTQLIDSSEMWWKEAASPHVLHEVVARHTRDAILNEDDITKRMRDETGNPQWALNNFYVANLVDEELSRIYARFNPAEADSRQVQSSSRAKGTRQEAPGKPANRRKTRPPSNRTAASTGSYRDMTDEQREAAYLQALEQAVSQPIE